MKRLLNNHISLIDSNYVVDYPAMIFTDDNIPVDAFSNHSELNTFIASKDVSKFPPLPDVGAWCEKGTGYSYGADKAKCLQSHNRMNFSPEETPALFTVIKTVVGYPEWVQPAGAHDAYMKGDRVHFPTITDKVYESLIDANVWSPTAYPAGWKKL